jgi:hypothetical protein
MAMSRKSRRMRGYLVAGAGLLLVGSLAAVAISHPEVRLDARHCEIGRPPPETLAIAIDVSDRLVSAQPREITYAVERELMALKQGDRVIVLDAAGEPTAEAAPIVDQCHPGDDDNVARNAFQRAIVRPIEDHLHDLQNQPASDQSPIAESILSLAADQSLHLPGSKLTILFGTDGLQNSELQSAYRRGSNFPKPVGTPLKGVTVNLVLMKNDRDLALQPREIARLRDWLTAAGATVALSEPGWLILARSEQQRGRP